MGGDGAADDRGGQLLICRDRHVLPAFAASQLVEIGGIDDAYRCEGIPLGLLVSQTGGGHRQRRPARHGQSRRDRAGSSCQSPPYPALPEPTRLHWEAGPRGLAAPPPALPPTSAT